MIKQTHMPVNAPGAPCTAKAMPDPLMSLEELFMVGRVVVVWIPNRQKRLSALCIVFELAAFVCFRSSPRFGDHIAT